MNEQTWLQGALENGQKSKAFFSTSMSNFNSAGAITAAVADVQNSAAFSLIEPDSECYIEGKRDAENIEQIQNVFFECLNEGCEPVSPSQHGE